VKIYICCGLDLDKLRDENPHLRFDLHDADTMPYFTVKPVRAKKCPPFECMDCGAQAKRTFARKHWYRISTIAAVKWRCPQCARDQRQALANAMRGSPWSSGIVGMHKDD
jgi:hypothetical protein